MLIALCYFMEHFDNGVGTSQVLYAKFLTLFIFNLSKRPSQRKNLAVKKLHSSRLRCLNPAVPDSNYLLRKLKVTKRNFKNSIYITIKPINFKIISYLLGIFESRIFLFHHKAK